MSTHGRSSSYGSGGWFQGTMEVISGITPRPSTPQGLPHPSSFSGSGANNPRSMSAPNSPARPGFFGNIARLPSQDSLDRSIHNESGHGKSTAQIIRDLKHSNASLSAKQASQEAQFMNQLSEVTKSFEEQRLKMDADIKGLKRHVAHLEAFKAAAESKLKEKEAALSKVKEESAFQRHTISDLKNQLYELQTDLDDAQNGSEVARGGTSIESRQEMQQLLTDNQEMARELHRLQQELRNSERARYEAERGAGLGRPPTPNSAGESPNGSYYQKYQETHSELERHRRRLTVTQSTLEGLQAEKKSLQQEHAKTIDELQRELNKQSDLFSRREQELLSQIESLQVTDSQATVNLQQELEIKEDAIADLQGQLRESEDKAADLSHQLAQAKQAAANQENYRRDEAEDLRVLHDHQEREISKLRQQLEDARRELELREEQLEDSNARLQRASNSDNEVELLKNEHKKTQGELETLRKGLEDTKYELSQAEVEIEELRRTNDTLNESKAREMPSEDPVQNMELQRELEEIKQASASLEEELELARKEHDAEVKKLQATVQELGTEKEDFANKLFALQRDSKEKTVRSPQGDNEFSRLRGHWEDKAVVVHEVDHLKNEIAIHKQRLQEAAETEKISNETIKKLESKVQRLEIELHNQTNAAYDLQRQMKSLSGSSPQNEDKVAEELEASRQETARLRQVLEEYEAGAAKTRKQLREAQIALVALDDEKKEMLQRNKELMSAVEKRKEEIQRISEEELLKKEKEIEKLQQELSVAKELEAEKDTLETRVRSLEAASRDVLTASPSPSVSSSTMDGATKSKLENTIRALQKEKENLKIKLKDRDTTISALVKSSMSLENKISTMENDLQEVRSVQSEEKKVTEGELSELRKTLSAMKGKDPKLAEVVTNLKKELEVAQKDALRWKAALEEDSGSATDYRFQISLLKKDLEESNERIKERDQAIENLVNQSMTQEAHVKDLKQRISSLMKEVETVRLNRSKPEDGILKAEIRRLQEETEMFAGQIIEQDEELQNLKTTLQQRDEQINLMQVQLNELKAHGAARNVGVNTIQNEEVALLKRQLSDLSSSLQERDNQVAKLQQQLETLKRESRGETETQKIISLQAELDEMKEANADNRAELRDLRKQLWEAKQAAGEANDLKLELAQAKYALDGLQRTKLVSGADESTNKTIARLESELKERNARIADLETRSSTSNERQVSIFQNELATLRDNLNAKTEMVEKLRSEIRAKDATLQKAETERARLTGELQESKKVLDNLQSEMNIKMKSTPFDDAEKLTLQQEKQSLLKEKEALLKLKDVLSSDVEQLKERIKTFEEAQRTESSLKTQLEQAKQAREASEKSIVDAYEKQLSAVTLDKDVTIDQLRRDLVEARGKIANGSSEMSHQLKSLHAENSGLREQFEIELQAKNQQIYALEHTLHAQEQIVESMRAEMDQLQSGMEHATEKRRGEVDDLQQEVINLEGKVLKQDRDITALKLQLEQSKLEHKAEVVRLKDVIVSMEQENPLAKTVADLQKDDKMLEVKQRLEQLKARNTTLQEENLKLGGRLERKVIEVRALQFDKERAEDLDKENSALRRQVNELESILKGSPPKASNASKTPPSIQMSGSASPSIDKENPSTAKEKSKAKKGLKGLFKRRGFSSDDSMKEIAEAKRHV